ncbi:alkaline phosphatase family protein [Paeniglutamicibacter sp. R2-26]|uniref:alkaline phosphatase family protein n=1 Tax=Paeniglutamicibacter sp. R2-26 TaxID=3144417 RepID=UPI003EE63FE7
MSAPSPTPLNPIPQDPSPGATRPKIALVGIDGLRIDLARGTGRMPTLDAVAEEGVFNDLVMEVPTLSGPGWSTLLTGSTHAEHGVKDNKFIGHTLLHRPDLLSRAYFADQSTTTMAAAGWPPLVDPADAGPVLWERREQQRSGHHRVISRDGETYGYQKVDAQIADHAIDAIASKGPDVSFIYFCDADDEGHVYGPHSPQYAAAMDRVEGHLARIKQAIARRVEELGEDWYLVLTTDHGHVDAGGHGAGSAVERASFVAATRFGASLEHWPEDLAPEELTPLLLECRNG